MPAPEKPTTLLDVLKNPVVLSPKFTEGAVFEPATNVKVSVAESATTSDWPATDIVLKASETLPPPPPLPVAASDAEVNVAPST